VHMAKSTTVPITNSKRDRMERERSHCLIIAWLPRHGA